MIDELKFTENTITDYQIKKYRRMKKIQITCFLFIISFAAIHAQQALTLPKALDFAMENSPSLVQSKLNLERVSKLLEAQNASLKTNFSLSVTPFDYNHTRRFDETLSSWNTSESKSAYSSLIVSQPLVWTDGRITLTNRFEYLDSYSEYFDRTTQSFSNNLYLSYSQPLFTLNRSRMVLDRLENNFENASIQYAMQKLSIERNVTIYFYNVYKAQKSVEITKEEYENQKISYEIIKNKVDGGLSAKEELFQAELNLATSKSLYENSKVELENAKDDFKILIGLPLSDDVIVLANIEISKTKIELNEAVAHAIEQRLELRQRQIDIIEANYGLAEAKTTNEFNGQFLFEIGLIGDDNKAARVYESPQDNERLKVMFNIPLYDWGERKARIKAEEYSIEAAELSLSDEKKQIAVEIRKTYRNLNNLVTQIEIARQNETNAKLTYEINLERYKNGDLTSMDLNLYQNQLSQKKNDLANAIINYKLELLSMKIQTLWDFDNNKSYLPNVLNTKE